VKLLNFGHPITEEQQQQIERVLGLDVKDDWLEIIDIRCQLDIDGPFDIQAQNLADECALDADEWQTEALIVNPPALSSAAVMLLAEIHGRCGYYPPCVRLKKADGLPPRYELTEVMDVDGQRQKARQRR